MTAPFAPFDGAAAWTALTPAQQAAIGAAVLDLQVARHVLLDHVAHVIRPDEPERIATAAMFRSAERLRRLLAAALPAEARCAPDGRLLLPLATPPGDPS